MDKENNKIYFYHENSIEIVQGKSMHSFSKHTHDSFCIGIVTDGKIHLRLKNEEYVLVKNDVYFIPPQTEHAISSLNGIAYGYIVICIEDISNAIRSGKVCNQFVVQNKALAMRLLESCHLFYSNHNYHQFYDAMIELIRENTSMISMDKKTCEQQSNRTADQLVPFIKEHVSDEFSLHQLSDYAHITKFHLVRSFKKQMDISPYQFYMQEKVRKTKQGLLKKQPLANLAYDLHFTDQSHMCNTFKKYVGITPKQFRKNYKNNQP